MGAPIACPTHLTGREKISARCAHRQGDQRHGCGGVPEPSRVNDAFVAVNRLLAAGEQVYWLKEPLQAGGTAWPAGTMYVPTKPSTGATLAKLASDVGLDFTGIPAAPSGEALRLKPIRIGVVDVYGGSMPSGWVQWLFTQFGFPFEVVYPPALDQVNLAATFDVLVFEDGIVPEPGRGEGAASRLNSATVPEPYRGRLGSITEKQTVPQLRQFLTDGGSMWPSARPPGHWRPCWACLCETRWSKMAHPGLPPRSLFTRLILRCVDMTQLLAYTFRDADILRNNPLLG